MTLLLDQSLDKVKVYASWFEGSDESYMTLPQAYEEIRIGRADIISSDTIFLKWKQKKFRTRILERDEYICYFCGEPGHTLEHLQPVSKGGKNTEENCVCSCYACNKHKGNMTEKEYWRYLFETYKKGS